jgi:hypothetical protein
MSRIRLSKVRRVDYRQPSLTAIMPMPAAPPAPRPKPAPKPRPTPPANTTTGLDHLEAINRAEAARHDLVVRDYSDHTLIAAAQDLHPRAAWDRKDPEQRFIMSRRAALQREILRRDLQP